MTCADHQGTCAEHVGCREQAAKHKAQNMVGVSHGGRVKQVGGAPDHDGAPVAVMGPSL